MKKQTPKQIPLTFEALMASIYENDRFLTEKFAETERIIKVQSAEALKEYAEIRQIFREQAAKNELERKEREQERERERKERERERKENERELKEKIAENDRIINNLSKQLGGMGNSNGDVAETYFRNSFAKSMYFAGQDFDHIDAPLKRKNKKLNLQAEYDIVMYNGASVAIIEIKYKVDKEDVDSTLEKVQVFKKLFPQYQDYAIYLGLAGLSIEANAEKKAIKQGIGIIKQVGDTVVINDAHLKAY